MSIKALQEYTRFSKYAKYIPEKKRRETWSEQVERVMLMHRNKFIQVPDIKDDVDFVEQMFLQKRVLGSQRALQFGGKPIIDKNARLYNCCAAYVDRPRFFQEVMYVLLCGCGAGFSVQKHHVDKMPLMTQIRQKDTAAYIVPDSIEGWSDAVGVLISSFCLTDAPFPEYMGKNIVFDFSLIRPAGAPISHGGKAPGPDGLRASLEKIRKLLAQAVKGGDRKLRPIEAYDIVMHISDSVLSGGVRRCLPEYYSIKMGDGTYKRITDIVVGDEVAYLDKKYPVASIFNNGVQDLVKINTKNGYHISTPNHRWLVYNHETKNVEWIEAQNLRNKTYSFVKECTPPESTPLKA